MYIEPGFRVRAMLAAFVITAAAVVGLVHASVDRDDAAPCPQLDPACVTAVVGPI
jgi:hypothetical protein